MKNFFTNTAFAFLFILIITSCSNEISDDQLVERKGVYYLVNSQTPFTGASVSLHPNGNIEGRFNYKDGKLHGINEYFYEDGNLESRTNYSNGIWNGLTENYWENGQLYYKYSYTNGVQTDGLKEVFHKNGSLRSTYFIKNGKYHGARKELDVWRNLKKEENYIDGVLHGLVNIYFDWDDDDVLISEGPVLKETINFVDGSEDGLAIRYFVGDSSYSKKETYWKNGKKHGWTIFYDKNGEVYKYDIYCFIEGEQKFSTEETLCNTVNSEIQFKN